MGATPEAAQDELQIEIKVNGEEKHVRVSVHGLPAKAREFLREMIPQFETLRRNHPAVARNFGLSYHQEGFRRAVGNVPSGKMLVFRRTDARPAIELREENLPVSCWCSEWDENWQCVEMECF